MEESWLLTQATGVQISVSQLFLVEDTQIGKVFPRLSGKQSREENRAVRKTALFPSQLWGKYSPHSIKGSVGNEIWCDQTCR